MRKEQNKESVPVRDVRFMNLTPHDINLLTRESGQYRNLPLEIALTIKPSGVIARVSYSPHIVERLRMDGVEIPVTKTRTYNVTNLPEPQPGVAYIVSKAVAEAARERDDLYILFGLRRSPNGSVLGGASLSTL
jgi:hypothetical protein